MPFEIYDIDYNRFIRILGTAHFTRRSIQEARRAVKGTGARDLAIELAQGASASLTALV